MKTFRANRHVQRLSVLTAAFVSASAFALVQIAPRGTWPSTWPKELDSFRGHATTIGVASGTQETWYEIPFTNRQDFEKAWPYILSLKSKGAPIILMTGPTTNFAGHVFAAGVRILCPPGGEVKFANGVQLKADAPWPESAHTSSGELAEYVEQQNGTWVPSARPRWRARVDLVLVTDERLVNTNYIEIPPGTIIIDRRRSRNPVLEALPAR